MDRRPTSNNSYGSFYQDPRNHRDPYSREPPLPQNYSINNTRDPNHYSNEFYNRDYYTRQNSSYNPYEAKYRELNEIKYTNQPTSHSNYPNYSNYSNYSTTTSSNYSKTKKTLGLPNLGNTCYMNTLLQCLFNTKKFATFFESGKNYIESPSTSFTEKFAELLCSAFSDEGGSHGLESNLRMFKYVVCEYAEQFRGYSEHDAHEFFRFVIEKIQEELNRSSKKQYSEFKPVGKNLQLSQIAEQWKKYSLDKEKSAIKEIFGGIILSELTCMYCNEKSYTFEDTLDLSLEIPSSKSYYKPTIDACLQDFIKEEVIENYNCEKCNRKWKVKKRMSIWKQPEILVLHLKRFVIDSHGYKAANKDVVTFPVKGLDLKPYCHIKSLERTSKYDLYAIVCHYGSLDTGHYTAIIWNEDCKSWFYYDDEKVKEISSNELNHLIQNSAEPYLLFYKST